MSPEQKPFLLIIACVNFGLAITGLVKLDDDFPEIIRNQSCNGDPYAKLEVYQYLFSIFYLLVPIAICCGIILEGDQKEGITADQCLVCLVGVGFLIFNAMTISDLNVSGCTNPSERPIKLVEDHLNFWFFTLIWPWVFLALTIVILILYLFVGVICVSMDRARGSSYV